MKFCKIFGVQVEVSPYLLVFMALYIGLGVWPQALAIFVLVFIHEWTHIFVAKGYGVQVKSVELLPFGGVARLEGLFEVNPVVETWVAVAGPASNLFMALCGLVIARTGWLEQETVNFFIYANLSVAFFNCIPALPLDGGRVLRAWLTGKEGYRKATRKASMVGQLGGLILALAGLLSLVFRYTDFTLLIIGVFVFLAARREEKEAQFVFLRYLNHKKEELVKSGILKTNVLAVTPEYPVKEVIRQLLPQRYTVIHIIDDNFALQQSLTETQVIRAMFEKGIDLPVREVLP